MKKITLILIVFGIVVGIWADAARDRNVSARLAYEADLVKIKLPRNIVNSLDLPVELNEETQSFGDPVLDLLMQDIGGTSIFRAHRKVNNKAWEIEKGFDLWFLIRLNGRVNVEKALLILKASPYITDACPEHFAYTQISPNDPYYTQNWGHNNTGQGSGGGGIGFDSNAPEAWDQQQGFGAPDIIIAIVDSGVNYNHVDLNDNCITGYDFGSNDSNPMDSNGHGTSCAGVAAGETNNSIGVAGVAGGCKIMPVKVMDSSGNMTFTSIANGVTYAADNGASVISMSLGAEGGTEEGDYPATDNALDYAYNAGCVILAATANSNTSAIAYPANHSAVISVGAASPTGQRKSSNSSDGQSWWGSNYGVNIQDDPKAVDIMAATILPATTVSGSYSTDFNGTSCATPYAAGVAALILSKDNSLTPDQVRTVIVSTATDMTIDGGVGWDRYTGYGMINANAALNSIINGAPSCMITAPANNSTHDLGSIINVSVTSTDAEGTVVSVDFYLDDSVTPAFTDTSAPYEWSWNTSNATPWGHTIRAVATDNENNSRQTSINVILRAPAEEGFETNTFNFYPWNNSSASPWIIQSSDVYSGTYAAKAGTITHLQTTSLSVEIIVTAAGDISFFNKVSSEANYDYMRFYIDGALQNQWSGTLNWTLQSFPVQAGTRTFQWTYYKDQGVNTGSDTVWLDHIVFPPHNSGVMAPSNLVALALSPTQIYLDWTDNSDNETEFFIESLEGGNWSLLTWAAENNSFALIEGLNPQSGYSFRVKAVSTDGSSDYSNVATATTLDISSPDNVLANADGNQVNLSWSAPLGAINGYEVWRFSYVNGVPANGVLLTPGMITQTVFIDFAWRLQAPGDYLWKVIAISNSGNSTPALSNPLNKVANGTIQGIVSNLSGDPLQNATVSIGSISATSSGNGAYSLSLVPGIYDLTISHSDYESVTIQDLLLISAQQNVQNIQLPLFTVETPIFSPEPGAYLGSVEVILSSATVAAEIRYTLDGTDPTPSSMLYSAAILLESSATIRARAYKLNCAPSEITAGLYEISVSNNDPSISALNGIRSIYPNPFSGSTKILLHFKDSSSAYKLGIYNLRGELVYKVSGNQMGDIDLNWDAKDQNNRRLASGIYFIKLERGNLKQTRKVVLK